MRVKERELEDSSKNKIIHTLEKDAKFKSLFIHPSTFGIFYGNYNTPVSVIAFRRWEISLRKDCSFSSIVGIMFLSKPWWKCHVTSTFLSSNDLHIQPCFGIKYCHAFDLKCKLLVTYFIAKIYIYANAQYLKLPNTAKCFTKKKNPLVFMYGW